MRFYLHYECPNCKNHIYDLCENKVKFKGVPVFDLDMASRTPASCAKCCWSK